MAIHLYIAGETTDDLPLPVPRTRPLRRLQVGHLCPVGATAPVSARQLPAPRPSWPVCFNPGNRSTSTHSGAEVCFLFESTHLWFNQPLQMEPLALNALSAGEFLKGLFKIKQ